MSGVLALMVTGGMVATVSPLEATGSVSGFPPTAITATTNTVTVTVQGGLAPYSYAWAKTDGDTVTVTAPTSATTAFTETEPPGVIFFATYRCTATDATGRTVAVDVPVTLNFIDLS